MVEQQAVKAANKTGVFYEVSRYFLYVAGGIGGALIF
jgi:hypothetical protein